MDADTEEKMTEMSKPSQDESETPVLDNKTRLVLLILIVFSLQTNNNKLELVMLRFSSQLFFVSSGVMGLKAVVEGVG